ncbi:MAG: hypothetical protein ACYDAL_16265 [Candidatus Dormibacteraceae bacterium]
MAFGVPSTGLPVGTVLVYNAHLDQSLLSWIRTGIGSADGLFKAIGDALNSKWNLTVVSSDYSTVSALAFGAPEPITITLQMMGPETYAQPDDVRSIVDGEIINALSSNPIVDSNISSFKLPPAAPGQSSTKVDTGAPSVDASPLGAGLAAVGIDPSAITNAVSDAVKKATSGLGLGSGIIILVLGLAIVAAVLVAVAPTAPARAIAAAHRRR